MGSIPIVSTIKAPGSEAAGHGVPCHERATVAICYWHDRPGIWLFVECKLRSVLGLAPFRHLQDQQGSQGRSVRDGHMARRLHGVVPVVKIRGPHSWSKGSQWFFGFRRFELVGRIF